jgi:hypothetical protein
MPSTSYVPIWTIITRTNIVCFLEWLCGFSLTCESFDDVKFYRRTDVIDQQQHQQWRQPVDVSDGGGSGGGSGSGSSSGSSSNSELSHYKMLMMFRSSAAWEVSRRRCR